VTSPSGGRTLVHLAVIHGPDEIYGLVAARNREAMVARLAERLQEDADLQLFQSDADRFRALIEEGRHEEAIETYFARVGEKWDPVRLRVEAVAVE
jgi:hypothetical protein